MIRTSEQIEKLADALAKAQAELENVARDADNPYFKSRYATLAASLDEIRPKFAKHGLSIVQFPVNVEGMSSVGVVTRLLHASGQYLEGDFHLILQKADAQSAGSALSYLRRYSLMAVAGAAPEDDDAEAAVGRPPQQSPPMTRNAPTRPAAPPPPLPPREGPVPSTEEKPAVTAARQRVRMLIDQMLHSINTAPNAHVLENVMNDRSGDMAEIEKAGGAEAAKRLRNRYEARMKDLEEQG